MKLDFMSKKNVIIVLIVVILVGGVMTFFVWNKNKSSEVEVTNIHAELPDKVDPNVLIKSSDIIIIGTVQDIEAKKVPSQIWGEGTMEIVSDVRLSVERYIKNSLELTEQEIVVRVSGGQVGNEHTAVLEDMPSFSKDEKALIFIKKVRDGSLRATGGVFGKYTIGASGILGTEKEKEFLKRTFGERDFVLNELIGEIEKEVERQIQIKKEEINQKP